MCKKRNPPTLQVGTQTGPIPIESSMAIFQKAKKESVIQPINSTHGYLPQKTIRKETYIPIFIALFTMANNNLSAQKQMNGSCGVYIDNGILLNQKDAICF